MAEKFNLLPKSQDSKKNSKAENLLKRIAIVTFIVSLLVLGGLISVLFFFNRRLENINSDINKTTTKISSLESTESGLVIAKDRAQKISSILALRENEVLYNKYLTIINSLPGTVQEEEIILETGKTNISLVGSNSKDFSDFIDWLMINSGEFGVLYANSVGLDDGSGYFISLEAK